MGVAVLGVSCASVCVSANGHTYVNNVSVADFIFRRSSAFLADMLRAHKEGRKEGRKERSE